MALSKDKRVGIRTLHLQGFGNNLAHLCQMSPALELLHKVTQLIESCCAMWRCSSEKQH